MKRSRCPTIGYAATRNILNIVLHHLIDLVAPCCTFMSNRSQWLKSFRNIKAKVGLIISSFSTSHSYMEVEENSVSIIRNMFLSKIDFVSPWRIRLLWFQRSASPLPVVLRVASQQSKRKPWATSRKIKWGKNLDGFFYPCGLSVYISLHIFLLYKKSGKLQLKEKSSIAS